MLIFVYQCVSSALPFYAAIVKRKRFHHIFASEIVLKRFFVQAILPNIIFMASTTQLNSDPDEYIRADMYEQNASCFIEALCENFEYFSRIINEEVKRCIELATNNAKRRAIFLAHFKGKIEIENFTQYYIIPEVSNSSGGSILVTKLDAIKFLMKHGSKYQIQHCLPHLEKYSRSNNKVESIYATQTLSKLKKMLKQREILSELMNKTLNEPGIQNRTQRKFLSKCSFEDLRM